MEARHLAAPLTGPVAEGERMLVLDALRGLAITDMLVANVFTFAYPMFATAPASSAQPGASIANRAVQITVGLLVEGKFYAMLSLLFGMGLMLQSRRAAERSVRFTPYYARRMLLLLAIGVAHGVLLYSADILSFYALIGLVALAFRGLSGRQLLIVASIVLVIGVLVAGVAMPGTWPPDWGRIASGASALPAPLDWTLRHVGINPTGFSRFMVDEQRIFQQGTWSEMTRYRACGALLVSLPAKLILLGPMVLGLFLLGMYLVEARIIDRLRSYRRFLWPAIAIGLILEIAIVAVQTVGLVGTLVLMAGYVLALATICARRPGAPAVRALAALGRLALTNYVAQSVVYGLLFHSTGLGLHARLAAWQALLVTPPLFLLQVAFSMLWLRRFQIGPLEWLWRRLTYGTRVPFLRAGPA